MRYQLKERVWSLRDSFYIKDSRGREAFRVTGKLFSIGDKLSLEDDSGNELAVIRQKIISLRPAYEIHRFDDDRQEQFKARIVKNITLFRDKYTVDLPGPDDYSVHGDFLDYNYEFQRGGRRVAQVAKRFFSIRDSYGVDIVDGEDDVTILAAAVVIDLISHDEEGSS